MKFASRLSNIVPSASMKVGLKENLKSEINLGIGVSDLRPPAVINEIILKGIKDNKFPYAPSLGSELARKNLFEILYPKATGFRPDEFILVSGAKWGISLALSVITNPGDNVILMEPYWLSYPAMCEIQECNISHWKPATLVNGELTFLIDDLRDLINKQKPSSLILNNPNNPSGKIFSAEFIIEVIELCNINQIWLIIDSVYRDLVFNNSDNSYSEKHFNYDNVIEVGSLSKSLSIPGLRIGYIRSNSKFIQNADLINQHQQTCINFISNKVCEGLTSDSYYNFINFSTAIYKERYNVVSSVFQDFENQFISSSASFYMLVELGKGKLSGKEVCDLLSQKEGIFVTPGINYGESFSTYIRLCLTLEIDQLKECITKMNKLFEL